MMNSISLKSWQIVTEIYMDRYFLYYFDCMILSYKESTRSTGITLVYTDQPKKKLFFRVLPRNTTCSKKYFSRRKIKINFCAESFLREISRRNSAKVRGENPQNFAEKLCEISRKTSAKSRWVRKDLRILHVDSEYSDRTVKLSESPGWYVSPLGARYFAGFILLQLKYMRFVSKYCDKVYICNIKRVIQMKRATI